jgi:quercetin dioxygenase-like cupin family protein
MAFNVPFTTSEFPVSMNNNVDIVKHDERLQSGKLGIVNPGGTVLRFVDFAPGFESAMHRTRSLDYGIVVEGAIELVLDSGEKQVLHRGDVCVQRGTNHAWRNPSETEWTRVVYILQDSQPVVDVGGQPLREYLGRSAGEIPASGND